MTDNQYSTIEELLDQLSEAQSQLDGLTLAKNETIKNLIPPEIKSGIDGIELEFKTHSDAAQANIAELTSLIKKEVEAFGATVKGKHLMAVWVKGRDGGYDTKQLDGMAKLIPEIAAAKKPDGKPTVAIKSI
jgi:hypothetical protein